MNYYDARASTRPAGWHYTCLNDGRIWPVGYCTSHEPHATKDEAYDCYTRYLLDNRLRLDGTDPQTQHHCQVCEESGVVTWTQRFAEVDLRTWHLCDAHRTREVVAGLFGRVGSSASSW